MAFLLRKEVGPFVLSESHILEEFSGRESYGHLLLPLDFLFQKMDYLMLGYEDIRFLSQGSFLSFKEVSNRAINVFSEPADDKIVPVYTPKKEFAVLARWKCNHGSGFFLKPEKVFQTIKNKGVTMKVIYNVDNYKVKAKENSGLVVALGNFDGIHLAHRKILRRQKIMQKVGAKERCVSFEPSSDMYCFQNLSIAFLIRRKGGNNR